MTSANELLQTKGDSSHSCWVCTKQIIPNQYLLIVGDTLSMRPWRKRLGSIGSRTNRRSPVCCLQTLLGKPVWSLCCYHAQGTWRCDPTDFEHTGREIFWSCVLLCWSLFLTGQHPGTNKFYIRCLAVKLYLLAMDSHQTVLWLGPGLEKRKIGANTYFQKSNDLRVQLTRVLLVCCAYIRKEYQLDREKEPYGGLQGLRRPQNYSSHGEDRT